MKTDLEKFKELFDSVGIKYISYEYPNNNGLTLQIELPDDSTVIYDFDTKGKYSETHVMN